MAWTPFLNQVYVVLGASINLAQAGFTVGYIAILLPQLKQPTSVIPINDDSGSWIAAIMGITQIIGNILVTIVMGKYGRRIAGLVAATIAVIGWIWIASASSITSLLIARSLQGIHTGMVAIVSSIVTGECSSPRNRGAFTLLLMLTRSLAALFIHTLGSYMAWQITALVVAGITFVDLLMLIYSPETPYWLAEQGRFDECKKVFQWLRGKNEDVELEKLIEVSKVARELKLSRPPHKSFKDTVTNLKKMSLLLKRKEFYIPVFIMFHIHNMSAWNGLIFFMAYPDYYYHHVVGPDVDLGINIILMDISRLIANIFGIYLMRTIRRKLLFGIVVGINTFLLFVVAIYVYAKLNNLLPFDHYFVGILLSHLIVASNIMGASSFAITITAEIYPQKFRSFAAGLGACIYSIMMFVVMKIIPFIINTYGMQVLFFICSIIMGYCLLVTLMFLPETKDRTLQDIEDELRGKQRVRKNESQSSIPLTVVDSN